MKTNDQEMQEYLRDTGQTKGEYEFNQVSEGLARSSRSLAQVLHFAKNRGRVSEEQYRDLIDKVNNLKRWFDQEINAVQDGTGEYQKK